MDALSRVLSARAKADFDQEWPAAKEELEAIFTPSDWGMRETIQEYTFDNVKNLWLNELSKPVREALESSGKTASEFTDWMGDTHYTSVALYLKSLFDPYQDNRGWRVLLMGIPAAGVMVGGIASHYQNAQRHNRLAEVSNLLYDQARLGLEAKGFSLPGRKIVKEDWDGTGLIQSPRTEICGVTLPNMGTDPGRVRIKYVRTTTVKKILASFICVMPLESSVRESAMSEAVAELEITGRAIA